jgi:hypothetical protein
MGSRWSCEEKGGQGTGIVCEAYNLLEGHDELWMSIPD